MKIPDDFWLGTSSSAWQVEGIAGKGKGQESWAELFYKTAPHKWYDGIGPEKAADFYHRYKEDIAAMARFGMNTFRFTIQWARFMKDPFLGIVDETAVAYYQDVIDTIRDHGMEPFVSLEHWDLPASVIEKNGGWASRQTVDLYLNYVQEVLRRLHGVTHYFAFTEPNIPIDNGYMDAVWYPFVHDPVYAYQAHFHKILSTSLAVKEARQYPDIEMGVMIHYTPVYARSGEIRDVKAAYYADLFHVRLYMDPYLNGAFPQELISELKKNDCLFVYNTGDLSLIQTYKPDILGIDYYFPIRVQARNTTYSGTFHPLKYYEPWTLPGRKFNADRGWEIYEPAIYDLGMRIKNEYGNKPWLISENGIGIAGEEKYRNAKGYIDDTYRIAFIKGHLESALQAKAAGCDCGGYLIWSFIDNVSAINAFKNRYGLLELDLETEKRIPKQSLYWLQKCMETHTTEP